MPDEQMLSYGSLRNINFQGRIGTGMTKQEWSELSEDEKRQTITEIVFEQLIDIGEEDG